VSGFLTAHQHIIGYSVPYNGLENGIKDGKYNQGYLATIKYEKRIIVPAVVVFLSFHLKN